MQTCRDDYQNFTAYCIGLETQHEEMRASKQFTDGKISCKLRAGQVLQASNSMSDADIIAFTYEGELLNGKPHGRGKASTQDNKVSFEGSFVNGQPEGFVVYTNTNQRFIWSGEFKIQQFGKATLYKPE